ncbi:MAG: 4-hydroxy-tetrahydrodipicolinate synthase [Clostridiales bacterium]|nr:4-hydroxy-tetrahydrodipicolinate synthase [Clostridiales bacterium]
MKNTIFTGAGVAIVTPMDKNGEIDYQMFGQLIDYNIDNGTDAIIVCGTTGESATMTDEEHIEAIKFTVNKVNKRVPVIAGTGSNDTAYALKLSIEAQELGADALLIVTPYYNKTSQAGLVKHFTVIADAVDIPIILYNIPGRTGINMEVSTIKELSNHKNIVAVKEASGNISYVAKLIAECGESIDVYSGNDDQIIPIMSLGGKGVISVISNCMPFETHEICALCLENRYDEARAKAYGLLEFTNNLFLDVNPVPIKEALNIMGFNVGECRLPLYKMSDSTREKLKTSMQKIGLVK